MNKIIAIGIMGMFLLTSFSVFVTGEDQSNSNQIILGYSFETPVFSKVDINNTIYDSITIEGAPSDGNPGEPLLPRKGSYILLPPNSEVSNIVVNSGERISLGSGYLVEPAGEPVPLSEVDSAPLPVPDNKIYSSNELFPGTFYSEVGTYGCRGYTILVLQLHPVQYIPASGELFYYPDLTVSVETIEETRDNSLFRGTQEDIDDISAKVDNPSIGNMYMEELQAETLQSAPSSPTNYDLLIITNNSLKSGFEPLKQAHNAEELNTLICTVENIYSHFQGVDNAEKIRNFIKYAYNMYGIEYVLLGGDNELIPARYLYIPGDVNNYFVKIPSDLYYGGLDGTWNNPENPYPINKDISINDPGVSGSGEDLLTGPTINSEDYVVGSDSMEWSFIYNQEPQVTDSGICKLMFNTPLDISNKRYINFQVKSESSKNEFALWYITMQDSKGFTVGIGPSTPELIITDSWMNFNTNIIKYNLLFNYKKVVSISFKFFMPYATEDDFIRLDGIYFSEWLDDFWGEPGEDDLYAEVYVGRACVDTLSDVNNFTSKTISYMNTDDEDEYLKKVLMVGEYLFKYREETVWGCDHMDKLIGKCLTGGYITQGFPEDKFNIDKLYDRDWPGHDWPKSELISRINNDVHIINHLGHGNNYHDMKLDEPVYMRYDQILGECHDVYDMTNDKYFFLYSQACLPGAFDNKYWDETNLPYDCIGEYMTVKTSHGPFACILNSRFGWGNLRNTNGPSQKYHRQFWDAVFSENITSIGKANQDSKEDNIWLFNINNWYYMRWCYYELNLFGDPAVQFKYLDSSLVNTNSQGSSYPSSSSSSSSSSSGSSSSQSSTQPGTTQQSTTNPTTTSK